MAAPGRSAAFLSARRVNPSGATSTAVPLTWPPVAAAIHPSKRTVHACRLEVCGGFGKRHVPKQNLKARWVNPVSRDALSAGRKTRASSRHRLSKGRWRRSRITRGRITRSRLAGPRIATGHCGASIDRRSPLLPARRRRLRAASSIGRVAWPPRLCRPLPKVSLRSRRRHVPAGHDVPAGHGARPTAVRAERDRREGFCLLLGYLQAQAEPPGRLMR